MSTRTDYSVAGGGGRGYVNVGGWNTTLTDRSTSQKEVPGIKRREGGNVYLYALQGTNSLAGSGVFVKLKAPAADADNLTSPIVFTALGAGTVIAGFWKGVSVCTADTNTYGWYFIQGILTLPVGVNSLTATAGLGIIVSPNASSIIGGATSTAQGYALTAITTGDSGQCYVKLM